LYSSVEISVLIHATENENKVISTIFDFIEQPRELVSVETLKTDGHWKNPILRYRISVNADVDKIFYKMFNNLVESYGEDDVQKYVENNTERKRAFYARLDKQKLCLGRAILSDRDSVRFVFKKPSKFKP
jgi:RNA binding exosome subunit